MAQGQFTREDTGNPLATSDLGIAPKTRIGLSGIRTGQGFVETDSALEEGLSLLKAGNKARQQKRENQDFIRGQLAATQGETEEELRARGGSRHEMAGMVSVEVSNMMTAWHQQQVEAARTTFAESPPEEYADFLAQQSADLVAQVGADPFAQRQLAEMLTQSTNTLAQAQRIGHQKFVENGIASEYGAGLGLSASGRQTIAQATAYGPRTNAGYHDYAESIAGQLIQTESGGDPAAQSKTSSAGGLGGFIDSTWIATVREHRPDMRGLSNEEILSKKTDPALNREMTVAHIRDNAEFLARNGFAVNAGNSKLVHFAGTGGASRILSASDDTKLTEIMTPGAITANPFLKDWDVGQIKAWAAKSMGAPAPTPLREQVMTNPGLPPERHRSEVMTAMLEGFRNDDPSLFEGAGGAEVLREIGATNAQIATVMQGYRAYKDRELAAYSMEYERGADEIVALADTGELSEDEIYERLENFQADHPRNDTEARRLFNEVAAELKENEVGVGWNTPEGLKFVLDATEAVKDAQTSEDVQTILQSLVEEGQARGIDPADTAKQSVALASAFEAQQDKRRRQIEERANKTRAQIAVDEEARRRLGTGTLDDGNAKVRAAGAAMLKQTIANDVQERVSQGEIRPEQMEAVATKQYVSELIQRNATDTELANQLSAAIQDTRGWGIEGDLPDDAVDAYGTYLEFVRGEQAPAGYMNRMFADQPEALAFFRTVQSLDTGSADTTTALRAAARMRDEPERMDAAITKQQTMNSDGFAQDALDDFAREAGLQGNWVQRRFGRLTTTPQQDADADALMEDPKLRTFLENASRTQIALVPGITPEAARKYAVGQALNQGAPILGNFVLAPTGSTVYDIAGISRAEGPEALNEIVQDAIVENFDQLPKSARESIMFALRSEAGNISGAIIETFGVGVSEAPAVGEISAETWRLETTAIEGDIVMQVFPTQATIDNWSKIVLGSGNKPDVAAMGTPITFSLSEAGASWNEKENAPSLADDAVNALVDFLRPAAEAAGKPSEVRPFPGRHPRSP